MYRNPIVPNKNDYYRRFLAGEFGNRPICWTSLDACLHDDRSRPAVGIRYKERADRRFTSTDVPIEKLAETVQRFTAAGADPQKLVYSAQLPDGSQTFQGELVRTHQSWQLHYTLVPKPMYIALIEDSRHASGAAAIAILKHYMPPKDFDWLMFLTDAYPDSVIEFSVFSQFVGCEPGFKTIFWEVRNY